ncbi:MAG TPA: DUF92 domain-containing protein [Candidatus Bathyarchaeia archaeon]|nr:DUF92 domain-containing protein [Candidatus Bathyarchaeia archaeon]
MIGYIWFTQLFGNWGWLIALSIAIALNVPIFIWARIKRHLTLFACFLAGFFGIAYWMINPIFYVMLFVFFISSSVLTNYRKKAKQAVQDKFEKGGERDTSQVLANGLGGFIFALAHLLIYFLSDNIILSNAFIYAFIATIGTVNADTWGTEIGILSNQQPYWILDLRKRVERGTSGGVSPKGTGAALVGSILVGGITLLIQAFWFNPIPESSTWQIYLFIPIAILCGFLGAIIDSIFGATLQGFFRCTICNKGTEKKVHCKQPTILERGKEWFRNDHVNFWASFIAGLIAFSLGCFGYLLN